QPTPEDLEQLPKYINHPNFRIAEEAIDGINLLPEGQLTPPIRAALREALVRGDPAISSLVAQTVARFGWKDFSSSLAAVYPLFQQADHIEPRISILTALGLVGDHSHLRLMQAALKDDNRMVVLAAA